MAYFITSDCINCGACESECPQHAIYSHEEDFSGSNIKPLAFDHYFINPYECDECRDRKKIPQCVEICPMNCIIK